MADHELRLVSKAVQEKDIKPALERGIHPTWFVNQQARTMWEAVIEHWQKYGVVPAPATLRDQLPGCVLLNVAESYEYLLDAFC